MSTISYIQYRILAVLTAVGLYEFSVKGAERITKTLSTLTDTIEQLHIGEEEALDEAADIEGTIAVLKDRQEELHTEAARAAKVKANLKTLMGE